ncbi:MAG: hypothetical protein DRO11_09505, partial [Methanobacteriota archaeon]
MNKQKHNNTEITRKIPQIIREIQRRREMHRIAEHLKQNNIKYMLTGLHLHTTGPNQINTSQPFPRDIDIYIHVKDLKKTVKTLHRIGYRLIHKQMDEHDHYNLTNGKFLLDIFLTTKYKPIIKNGHPTLNPDQQILKYARSQKPGKVYQILTHQKTSLPAKIIGTITIQYAKKKIPIY